MTATAIASYIRITPKGVFAPKYSEEQRAGIIAAIKANSPFYDLLDANVRQALDSYKPARVNNALITIFRLESLIEYRAAGQKIGDYPLVDAFIARYINGEPPASPEETSPVTSTQYRRPRRPRMSGRRAAAKNGNGLHAACADSHLEPAAATSAVELLQEIFSEPQADDPAEPDPEIEPALEPEITASQPEPTPKEDTEPTAEEQVDHDRRLKLLEEAKSLHAELKKLKLPGFYRRQVEDTTHRIYLRIETLEPHQLEMAVGSLQRLQAKYQPAPEVFPDSTTGDPEAQSAAALKKQEAFAKLGDANHVGPAPSRTVRGMPVPVEMRNGKPRKAGKKK